MTAFMPQSQAIEPVSFVFGFWFSLGRFTTNLITHSILRPPIYFEIRF